MANVAVPVHASVEKCWTGTYKSDAVEVTLYTGYASDGYKSDFERRPARWLVWERFDSSGKRTRRMATRYGGRRFDRAPTEYADAVRQLIAAGAQPTTRAAHD